MSVDLEKNKSSILEAYKDVLSDNSETDWYVDTFIFFFLNRNHFAYFMNSQAFTRI